MPAAFCSPLLVAAAAEPVLPISIQTALLILLGIGLVLTAKSLADLRRRVDTLTTALRSKTPPPSTDEALPPEIVAVIAAAVSETLESDHRIVAINSTHHDNASWSQEGRRQVFAGRKVR